MRRACLCFIHNALKRNGDLSSKALSYLRVYHNLYVCSGCWWDLREAVSQNTHLHTWPSHVVSVWTSLGFLRAWCLGSKQRSLSNSNIRCTLLVEVVRQVCPVKELKTETLPPMGRYGYAVWLELCLSPSSASTPVGMLEPQGPSNSECRLVWK